MVNPDFYIEPFFQFSPFFFLYAELHYRFKYMGSRYYQKEPEINADAPYRIEPGESLPIYLLIKDAHIYPIYLQRIQIDFSQNKNLIKSLHYEFGIQIEKPWWEEIIEIPTEELAGNYKIEVHFTYICNGSNKSCITHNYPQSAINYLNTYISNIRYPRKNNVQYGDLHYHTNLTEDMVEFGASISASAKASSAMGLDFFCTTDHSYDLDDREGSWYETDPDLKKWKNSRKKIQTANKNNKKVTIIPSEELSLHNAKGQNVHALILNNNTFLPGAGDGGEKPFDFSAEYNTSSVHKVLEKNSLCIAAHPFNHIPFTQKLLFKRGSWGRKDIIEENLAGLQILNGTQDEDFYCGLREWKSILLAGYKKLIFAGNDAHGNFNIYRQIKTPFFSLREVRHQIFGEFRTGVLGADKQNINSLINSLKEGNCFITNGAFLNLTINHKEHIYPMGSIINGNEAELIIDVLSSEEFGNIISIKLFRGIIGENEENIIFQYEQLKTSQLKEIVSVTAGGNSYFRCEVELENGGFAYSNPIWLQPIL